MPIKTMDSSLVRKHWRDALDTAATGRADLVITRYGRPFAAMICYADYVRLRAAQQESC